MPNTQLTRRGMMASAAAGLVLGRKAISANADAPLVKPLPRQVVWQDCEVGAIFHFDMPLFAQGGRTTYNSINQTWDPQVYKPTKLDTDQWAAAAKAMGARYAIFTATHFNGFLQWQSNLYPYGVKQAAWRGGKGDVVKDFVESCRKADIKPGLYMSCFRNAYWKVNHYRVNRGKGGDGQAQFARTCEKMFEELCTRYGELVQIWFDAGNISPADGGPDLLPIADKHQKNTVFYHSPQRSEHRWIGNEAGHAGYPCWATMPGKAGDEVSHNKAEWRPHLHSGDPDGGIWSPGMVDTVLRDHYWFWRPNTEQKIESLDRLVRFYYQSVGRNANLVLGLVVDPTGLVPEPDVRRCAEFGAEIRRRFGKPAAETQGIGNVVTLDLKRRHAIDHIAVMEDITQGERIRKYTVEGLTTDGKWQPICEGVSVGHKRIQQFKPVSLTKLRLRVRQSVATPLIRSFSAFHTSSNEPRES